MGAGPMADEPHTHRSRGGVPERDHLVEPASGDRRPVARDGDDLGRLGRGGEGPDLRPGARIPEPGVWDVAPGQDAAPGDPADVGDPRLRVEADPQSLLEATGEPNTGR